MMQHLFTRTTANGHIIEGYGIEEMGMWSLVVTVDGKRVFNGSPGVLRNSFRAQLSAEFTHEAGNGKICVPLLATEIAAWKAAEPASQPTLAEQRRTLVEKHNAIAAEIDDVRARNWDAFDGVSPLTSPELDAAFAALKAFDAAHPEIKAALEAERRAAVERNRWM